jgi:hypothetical protein
MPNVAATLSLNVPAITALCKGDPGYSLLHGDGGPAPSVGNYNDFYLDSLNYVIYGPKTINYGWGTPTVLTNSVSAGIWNSVYSNTQSLSNNWQTAYRLVSAGTLSTTFNTVSSLSSSWTGGNSAYTTLSTFSANWISVYATVSSLSANWQNATNASNTYTTVYTYSANWQSTYSTVTGFSAQWLAGGNTAAITVVQNNSGDWNATHNQVYGLSANWQKAYNQVYTVSGNWNQAYQSLVTDIEPNTGYWNQAYSQVYNVSGNWKSVFDSVCSLSAGWQAGTSFDPTKGNQAWTTTWAYSGGWESVRQTSFSLSAQWQSAYQIMNQGETFTGTGSAAWQAAWDAFVVYYPLIDSLRYTMSALSGAWPAYERGSTITQGLCTLAAGTVTVANPYVSAVSKIYLTIQIPAATPANIGTPYVFSKTPATGFVIKSTNASDTSTVAYHIVNGINGPA